MFLHLGKETIIKQEEMIAMISLESILKKKSIEDICKSLNINDNIIDIADKNKKSLILVKEKDKLKGYITNISTNTLAKRILW